MKAVWNGQIIAESDKTLLIEGNHYFPPDSVKREFYRDSDYHTECFWKGTASYYHVEVDGDVNENAAWYYSTPKEGSIKIAGGDFTDYVAFWNGVEVTK